jgi:hypothetical protein
MPSDPYAQYLTPPSGDPYSKYLNPAAASSNAYQPGFLDKITNIATHAATLGLDDPLSSAVGQAGAAVGIKNQMPGMQTSQNQRSQFRSDVGPLAANVADIAGYAAPGGGSLGGVGEGLGGLAQFAASKGMGALGTGALEGGVAGGVTGAAQGLTNQDVLKDPASAAESVAGQGIGGAAVGGGVGAAGGLLGKLVGWGANKALPKPSGSALPDITAQLEAAKIAAYGQGDAFQFHPNTVVPAYVNGIRGLDLDQKANVSSGFQALLKQHVNLIDQSPMVTAGNIDGLARGLQNAAQSPADGVLANKIASNLQGTNGVLGSVQPISGQAAGDARVWQRQANTANAAYQNATGLQEASQNLDLGQDPSGWAISQIKQFYPDPSPTAPYAAQRKALASIASSTSSGQSALNMMHAFDPLAEAGGFAVGGLPGAVGAGMGMHLVGKPLLGKALGASAKASAQTAIRNAYPILTGATPAQPPKGVGSLIQSLMVGGGSPAY